MTVHLARWDAGLFVGRLSTTGNGRSACNKSKVQVTATPADVTCKACLVHVAKLRELADLTPEARDDVVLARDVTLRAFRAVPGMPRPPGPPKIPTAPLHEQARAVAEVARIDGAVTETIADARMVAACYTLDHYAPHPDGRPLLVVACETQDRALVMISLTTLANLGGRR